MFGPSETGIIRDNLSNPNKDKAIEMYYENYSNKHAQLVRPNQEIHNLIMHLKAKGIKLGIVTGKAKKSLDISLRALSMVDLFDVIITGDDVIMAKPHPEGLTKALTLIGSSK